LSPSHLSLITHTTTGFFVDMIDTLSAAITQHYSLPAHLSSLSLTFLSSTSPLSSLLQLLQLFLSSCIYSDIADKEKAIEHISFLQSFMKVCIYLFQCHRTQMDKIHDVDDKITSTLSPLVKE
jgi:hypothetical protein